MKKPLIKYTFCALVLAGALTSACKKNDNPEPATTANANSESNTIAGATVLGAPVAEKKVYKLLPGYDSGDKFEASGVQYLDGYFYVIFDNLQKVAKIKSTLPENSSQNTISSGSSSDSGFESITYSPNTSNFYVTVEAEKNGSVYNPRVWQYSSALAYQSKMWANYHFTSSNSNKGFEGTAYINRGGQEYLLGLVGGTGKIEVMQKTSTNWNKVAEITLPSSVTFTDYSDIALLGTKVAITSQEDSQLWIGTLSATSWAITGGTAYTFPKGDKNGVVGAGTKTIYQNIEGVSFITANQIVVVSDKAKDDQESYTTYKDQSVHIFNIP